MSDVSSHYRHPWEDYPFFAAQQTWVDACGLARQTQIEVRHSLLDKVRQCSAFPDQAALFFQKILNPIPHLRVEALDDAWCANAVSRMFAETGTSYTPVLLYEDIQSEADKSIQCGFCASLLRQLCCLNTQTRLDSNSSVSGRADVVPVSALHCSNAQSRPVPSSGGSVPPKQQGYVSRARNAVSGLFSRRKHQASGAKPAAAELSVAAQIKGACSASGTASGGLAVLSVRAASESGKVALLQQQPSHDRLGVH
ncbi:TPA: hypothetical protein ACH3X1_016177 [Trebouxia sp. C0004]